MKRPDLLWRSAVVLAAALTALLGAPQPVVGALVVVALLVVGERLARLRGRGALDTVLVLVGGALVALVLVGLVLGSTPVGLSATTWAVGLSLVAALGVVVLALHPRSARPVVPAGARAGVRTLPWLVVGVLVAAFAVSMSVNSVSSADQRPVQMSLGTVSGNRVEVVVSADEKSGPLEIRTSSKGTDLSYPLFTVEAGESVTTDLTLPDSGRYRITLNYPDQTQPLRSLTIDR